MAPLSVKRLILEEEARPFSLASKILERVRDLQVVSPEGEGGLGPAGIGRGKQQLRLVSYPGEVLRPCPGTKGYLCCGYRILHVGTNCPLDCSYCILQSYFRATPDLSVFVNFPDRLDTVLEAIDGRPDTIFRMGTGEFMDSLALDPLVDWGKILLGTLSSRKNVVLEFKTKTDRIRSLLASPHRAGIVVSWSLNSPYVVSHEEHGTASLRQRLEAARTCQSEEFVVGFHFDPLIHHPHWEENYLRTLDLLDHYIDPKGVIWISMGAFRFMPGLKWIIRSRHPESRVLDGEFVMGLDGKRRYFKPIRIELYSRIKEALDGWNKDFALYLCMEADDVWRKAMGWSPGSSLGLSRYLDERAEEVFGSLQ